MKKCKQLALKAGDNLYEAIETLEELCSERAGCKVSTTKYRRLAIELTDMVRLLRIFIRQDMVEMRRKRPRQRLR